VEQLLYELQFKMAEHRARSRRPSSTASATAANISSSSIEHSQQQQQQQQQQQYSSTKGDSEDPSSNGHHVSRASSRHGADVSSPLAPSHSNSSFQQQQPQQQQQPHSENAKTVADMRAVVSILELKVAKLEQLVSLKDHKIDRLQAALRAARTEAQQAGAPFLDSASGAPSPPPAPVRRSRAVPPAAAVTSAGRRS
jgi:uncharacterized membrane protein YkoI